MDTQTKPATQKAQEPRLLTALTKNGKEISFGKSKENVIYVCPHCKGEVEKGCEHSDSFMHMDNNPACSFLGTAGTTDASAHTDMVQRHAEAVNFMRGLFELNDTLCITFIHSTEVNDYGQALTQNKFGKTAWYITDKGLAALEKRNIDGWHVYVSMQPFKPGTKQRLLPNVSVVRHVFLDLDNNGPESLVKLRQAVKDGVIPQPAFIVESSPNKYHIEWNVEDIDLNQCRALNKALQDMFNGDPQTKDPARVLRVPGFKNVKPKYGPDFPIARIVERGSDDIYFLADFHLELNVVEYNTSSDSDADVPYIEFDEAVFQAVVEKELAGPPIYNGTDTDAPEGALVGHDATLFNIASRLRYYAADEQRISDALIEICEARCQDFGDDYKQMCEAKAHNVCERYEPGTVGGKPILDASKHSNVIVLPLYESGETSEAPVASTAEIAETAYGVEPARPVALEPSEVAEVAEVAGNEVPSPKDGATLSIGLSVNPVPQLSDDAYYGIVGEIIRKLSPQTESHPAGNMLELLAALGNIIGRSVYYRVEDDNHFPNIFTVRVGDTSKARKGTGRNRIRHLMSMVDSRWVDFCEMDGLASGEALIYQIRDKIVKQEFNKKTGTTSDVVVDEGVDDKRLYISTGEFAGVLNIMSRPGNTLSPTVRNCWDGKILRNVSRTYGNIIATNPHVSISADITAPELKKLMLTTEHFNGFANRFLWVHTERQALQPFGGEEIDWTNEVLRLRKILNWVKSSDEHREFQSYEHPVHQFETEPEFFFGDVEPCRRVFMTERARKMWERIYRGFDKMTETGVVGAIAGRGEPQIIRMALILCVLDKATHIDSCHLRAAEAIWEYCLASVRHIFDNAKVTGDKALILEFLKENGASTLTDIHALFGYHRASDWITEQMESLIHHKLVRKQTVKPKKGGKIHDVYEAL